MDGSNWWINNLSFARGNGGSEVIGMVDIPLCLFGALVGLLLWKSPSVRCRLQWEKRGADCWDSAPLVVHNRCGRADGRYD